MGEYTLKDAVALYEKESLVDGDYYNTVSVFSNTRERLYYGHSLSEVKEKLSSLLDEKIEDFYWHDEYIAFYLR